MTCQWLSRCLLVPALLETSDGAFTFQDVARLRVIHAGCLDAVIDDEIERVDQEHHRSSMRPKTSAKLPSGSGSYQGAGSASTVGAGAASTNSGSRPNEEARSGIE